jgi:hypothetical protein
MKLFNIDSYSIFYNLYDKNVKTKYKMSPGFKMQ